MLITLGVMSIIPVFLVVFIPSLISHRSGIAAGRQKTLNAIEVWKDDLGPDSAEVLSRVPK
jgi:competence protein ComGC